MSGPNIIQITERGDPRIAPFVSVRERDLTGGTDGRFIVEGKVPLEILLTRSRFAVDSLFLCETRLAPLENLLQCVPDDVPVYTAPQALMDEIAGFPIHRGILSCARKGEDLALEDLIKGAESVSPGRQTLLVLNQISNHDNVGAALRHAAAFGATGVILDAGSCDPLYRKSIRVSSGSALWLPYHRGGTGEEHIAALQTAGFTIWALTPNPSAPPIGELVVPQKLALLLGAEGPGLPEALMAAAQPVRIPMVAGFDSVNVATAGAIALAHVFEAN
mgnify:CR=1 FL=1